MGTDLCDDQARKGCVLEYAEVAAGSSAKRRARAGLAMVVGRALMPWRRSRSQPVTGA